MKWKDSFKALQYKNYRLYFSGQLISMIGTWMQRMAVSWLVYDITHSAMMLGITAFAGQIPTFLLSLPAGVTTDRHNRYKILLTTQVASMIQAGALAAIVLLHIYNMPLIIGLSAILGIINAYDMPSRQSLIVNLVKDKKDVPNAIALNSSLVNLARLIGPSIAGIILLKFGEGICFLINALSFIAVIGSLLTMRIEPGSQIGNSSKRNETFSKNMLDGIRYLKNSPFLKMVLGLLGMISLVVMPYSTLIPVFAKDIFHGNAGTFGWLNSVAGIGALGGAFYLTLLKPGSNIDRHLGIAAILLGIFLTLFGFTRFLPLGLLFMAGIGFGTVSCIATGNTELQTHVSDEMRGRVISFYSMAFFGMQPIGSFLIGLCAEHIGSVNTLRLQGIIGIVIALFFYKNFPPTKREKTKINISQSA